MRKSNTSNSKLGIPNKIYSRASINFNKIVSRSLLFFILFILEIIESYKSLFVLQVEKLNNS